MNKIAALRIFKRYYIAPTISLFVGLILAFFIDGPSAVWTTFVLSILEVSLSFDNAIVNAQVMKNMDSYWKHWFITWGMLIAVGGMRLLFPLIIVGLATDTNPWDALMLAINDKAAYKEALTSVHTSVMGFGQSFLMMVGLTFFINHDKDIHWLDAIERRLTVLGEIEAIQAALTLGITLLIHHQLLVSHGEGEANQYLMASLYGLILYISVRGLEAFIGVEEGDLTKAVVKTGLTSVIYLEVLDASFSFDGVLGAFALSDNLFIIAIGLGVGAWYVRSMTIMMDDNGTIDQFKYLEHGAFYAIISLAVIMNLNTMFEISETITGLIGAAFIGASLISSISYNRKHAADAVI